MRLLCSQVLADEDIEALEQGYSARVDEALNRLYLEEANSLLSDPVLREPARILAALVARGVLDLKIAILRKSESSSHQKRIFHDKLGLFRDPYGNVVMFKGSMNETWTGLAEDGNLESVDVAASWLGARDLGRTQQEEQYFTALWRDRYPTLHVRLFPEIAKEEFKRNADLDWEATLERSLRQATSTPKSSSPQKTDPKGRTLRPHQAAGLASWHTNGRRGILEFATGSGKTFTAITAIRESISVFKEVVLVVVPDQVLFEQWDDEIRETTADLDIKILRAGAGHSKWQEHLALWSEPGDFPRLILATVRTASSDRFLRSLVGGEHLMIVADEVHRLGSPRNSNLLNEAKFGPRLGLSATPERAGDPVGTGLLLEFFRGILEPRYSLADAVRDGVLSRYFYRPHVLRLNQAETQEWQRITNELSRINGRLASGDTTPNLGDRRQGLLIQRARVIKQAEAKVPLAVEVISEHYERGQRWIVYCEDLNQLERVSHALEIAGYTNIPFHSQMEGNREQTLKWLERVGGIVVAIKCLDEGVDVPSVSHALILASSKNPREYIQRRGRVLRKDDSKSYAHIHDAIVLPFREPGEVMRADPITTGELARAVQFAEYADNPAAAADLQGIAIDVGLDWRELINEGVEDEED